MKKIQLRDLAAYLPYGLKCQYNGIINGADLKAQEKAYALNGEPFEWSVTPIDGLKVGIVKSVHLTKSGNWRCYIGVKGGGKAFYNGYDFKPILRPLSDLYNTEGFSVSKMISHGYHNTFWSEDNFNVNHLYYHDLAILLEYHFDVFKLIGQGLALSTHEIKN